MESMSGSETGGERPTIVVDRPIEQVFDFISDLDKAPQWAPQMGPIVERSGPVSEGMSFGEVRRFLGRRSVARWTFARVERPRLMELRMRWGPLSGWFAYHFEPAGPSATRITQDLRFRLGGPLAPLSRMITSEATKEETRELVRLKALLEGAPA